jgi:predicted ABC-type ATPase
VKPSFTVVAGPNGSGKSSLTAGSSDIFGHFPLIDPDAIARTIQVNSKNLSALAAGREALSQAASFLEASRSFAVETTLSGHNYLQMMSDARDRGFEVVLIYVGTKNSDINMARVANRVTLGGHDVPEVDIRRRYERSLRNLPLAIALADHAILLDNSTEYGYQLVAHFDHGTAQWFQDAPSWAAALVAAK